MELLMDSNTSIKSVSDYVMLKNLIKKFCE